MTTDLVRVRARGDLLSPRLVPARDANLLGEAARLIAIFADAPGLTVGELDERVADHIGDSTDFLVQRGLTKLLKDKWTSGVQAAQPPVDVRQVVFDLAQQSWPIGPSGGGATREQIIDQAALQLGLTPAQVSEALYADLKLAERVLAVSTPSPPQLIDRYNLALAQGILLRASEVRITAPGAGAKRARQLFRMVKFHRLMHRVTRQDGELRIVLDGPVSLLRQTQRYGKQLASFLPTLCLCERWALSADVTWGKMQKRPYRFEIDHTAGLVTHARDQGTWESAEEKHFRKSFAKLKTPWILRRQARVIDLDAGRVMIPDYTLAHPDGRTALLDLVWFWRRATFERHLATIAASGPPNLIVAVAVKMNTDESTPTLGQGRVYAFKGVIHPKRIVALAEEVGV